MNGPDPTGKLTVPQRRDALDPVDGTVADLIRAAPVVGGPRMTVREAAILMTERAQDYVVIPLGGSRYAVVTDADLRSQVVAAGRDSDTPLADIVSGPAFVLDRESSSVDAMTELLDRDLTVIPVLDADGTVLGVVAPADFVAASTGSSMTLRDQIAGSVTEEDLQRRARRIPQLIADLLRRGRGVHEITRVLSLLNDAVVHRGLEIVLARHPELDAEQMTWLSLGSNARREPVLTSDVDSAVSLSDSLTDGQQADYRSAFGELDTLLVRAGMRIDANGALASSRLFCRTHSQWRGAARRWVDEPLENKGMIFISLMLDARAIWGPTGGGAAEQMLNELRLRRRTRSLLLAESLATRARLRSVRDVVTRNDIFDIKQHALIPLVNTARWASLAVGAAAVDTRSRLKAAAGSETMSDEQATTLIEVFDVLQRVRLTYQVAQFDRGEELTDQLSMKRLSPLDRSLLGQAVREIAGAQRRLANMSQYAASGQGSTADTGG